jgi:formylglycine-generating enzyme required for sulfatase activity
MSHIFISYSRKDQPYARQLADELLHRGFDVWIDDNIDYGDRWQRVIFKAIDDCSAIIVLMSPASAESEWVEREYNYAHKRRKPQFPILLEGEEFPFYVTSHFVDVLDGSLPKDDFYARLQRVIKPKESPGKEITSPIAFVMVNETPKEDEQDISLGSKLSPSESASLERSHKPDSVSPQTKDRMTDIQRDIREFPIVIRPKWVGSILPEPFELCVVPAGEVTLEPSVITDDYLKTMQVFFVPEFKIARYPITNAQFTVFAESNDGWSDAAWWNFSRDAMAWRVRNQDPEAPYFRDCSDCPRETVTWYAALAFTRWLSAKVGEQFTLPSEQQWQRAAQGNDGYAFPWGKNGDTKKSNSYESNNKRTTPVTYYPLGASPFGVLDMSGNVWEWCSTDFKTGQSDIRGSHARVLRGGSWDDYEQVTRVTFRGRTKPLASSRDVGFRVVKVPKQ